MNESQRRKWLATLLNSQLQALLHVAGIYHLAPDATREQMINNLALVEGIEVPKKVQ